MRRFIIDYDGILKEDCINEKYLDLEELKQIEAFIKKQKTLIKNGKIEEKFNEILKDKKPIRIESENNDFRIRYIEKEVLQGKTKKWMADFKISYLKNISKQEDTSQYEIENGLKKEYPLELASGEVVHNKNEFLSSDYWHFIKETYKQKRGKKEGIKRSYYVCEKCGNLETANLHLHHLTYRNFGNEKAEELIRICYKCHCEIHGNEPVNKKEYEIQRRAKTSEIEQGLSFESIFPFKKYKGLTVKEVIEKDKNYLKWIITNTDLKFNEEVFNTIMTEE